MRTGGVSRRALTVVCALLFCGEAIAAADPGAAFQNGTSVCVPQRGYINLRTNLDGEPLSPNDGTEVFNLGLPVDASWKVKIPPGAVETGKLRFLGSNATEQSGTGSIQITFTAIKVAATNITVDVTFPTGATSSENFNVRSFRLLPEYKSQDNPKCVIEAEGAPGDPPGVVLLEATTSARKNRPCKPVVKFEDCKRACDVTGDVTISTSNSVRRTEVEIQFVSSFRIISDPIDPALTERCVKADVTAREKYQITGAQVHCPAFSGGTAAFVWQGGYLGAGDTGTQMVAAAQVLTRVDLGTSCPSGIGTPQDPDDSFPATTIEQGILQPREFGFQLNLDTPEAFGISHQHRLGAFKNGSFARGNITFDPQPFLVRIVPKPMF